MSTPRQAVGFLTLHGPKKEAKQTKCKQINKLLANSVQLQDIWWAQKGETNCNVVAFLKGKCNYIRRLTLPTFLISRPINIRIGKLGMVCLQIKLILIGMTGGHYSLLVLFGSDFVICIFIKKFQTFLEVKIDIIYRLIWYPARLIESYKKCP